MSTDDIVSVVAAAAPRLAITAGASEYVIPGGDPRAPVTRPESAEQVAELLAVAQTRRWRLAPAGGGTMLELGNPIQDVDLVLDLRGLNRVVDYQPDDLTLTVEAGTTFAEIAALLGGRGQSLPLDVPLPARATVGGALAANASGPRRLRYGTGRDLVIGMQAALPGGSLARSGGRVVKNVAGYDLGKMQIGALGTLGVVTEVTFKLWPSSPALAVAAATFAGSAGALAAASALLAGQLFPSAVEIAGTGARPVTSAAAAEVANGERWTLVVLFEGLAAGVKRQVAECSALVASLGGMPEPPLEPPAATALMASLRDFGREPGPGTLLIRASVRPSECGQAIAALEAIGNGLRLLPRILVRPGAGIAFGLWDASETQLLAEAVNAPRSSLRSIGGSLVVERQPATGQPLECWGFDGPDLGLMRRLKAAFDPAGILNPGRFAGGI